MEKIFFINKNNPTHFTVHSEGYVTNSLTKERVPVYETPRSKEGRVYLCKRYYNLGKLIADYFLENPQGFTTISYIDGDTNNCCVDNLRWGKEPPKEEHRPAKLNGENTHFVITKTGKVFNLNTGKENKNYNKREISKHIQITHRGVSYSRALYLWYAETFNISAEEAYQLIEGEKKKNPEQNVYNQKEKVVLFNLYTLYPDGKIINNQTKKEIFGSLNGGYRRVKLIQDNNIQSSFSLHRLVAENFLSNPEGLQFVHHKDNNRDNNCYQNLEWATREENNAGYNKTSSFGNKKVFVFDDKFKEEWKPYPNSDYLVSNYGRVKNLKTKRILSGSLDKKGYHRYNLTLDGQLKGFLGHVLVWEVFKGNKEESNVINHIDGDKSNNRLDNLESVSQSENVRKAIHDTQSFKKWGKITCTDIEGNEIGVYLTSQKASEALGIPSGTIRSGILKGNLVHEKYYFTRSEGSEDIQK